MSTSAQSTKVLLKTSLGEITLMLYDDTPMHRDNFVELVNDKFYDGILFHRVIPGFMIQAGDPNSKGAKSSEMLGSGTPGHNIPAEFKPARYHKKGALAAARQGDNVNPTRSSSGSQFYIVVGRTWSAAELENMEKTGSHPTFTPEQKKAYMEQGGYPSLDYAYTVFGEILKGMEVVENISKVKRDQRDRPSDNVTIISATIIK